MHEASIFYLRGMNMKHISVLLNECIEGLNIKEDGIYVDATLGGGGHSSEILKRLTTGHLYCFDQDDYAIGRAKERLSAIGSNFTIIKSNFVNLKEELNKLGVKKIDGILYDLGVSSFQFDDPERGFSYKYDAYLDMRMDQTASLTAHDIVNTYSVEEIAKIISKYGEDPFAYNIAKKIVASRNNKPINTTFELVDVIKSALPQKVLNKKVILQNKHSKHYELQLMMNFKCLKNQFYKQLILQMLVEELW